MGRCDLNLSTSIQTSISCSGGEEVADDVRQQAPEQAELGGDRPRQPVLRRRLPLPSCRPPRRLLRPASRVPPHAAGTWAVYYGLSWHWLHSIEPLEPRAI